MEWISDHLSAQLLVLLQNMSVIEQPPISTDILQYVSTKEEENICQSCFSDKAQGIVECGRQERCAAVSPWVKGGNTRQHERFVWKSQPSSSLARARCITAVQSCRTPLLPLLCFRGREDFQNS